MTPEQLAKSNTEAGHQRAYFAALHAEAPGVWALTFAIPNGGKREAATAANLKAEGVKSGVPDVFCACPCNGYAGLFIEMKRPEDKGNKRRKGTTQDSQDEWHALLLLRGYAVVVCYTWIEALEATRAYFTNASQFAMLSSASLNLPQLQLQAQP